jgi:GT2 family glycosyltransferase
VPENSLENHPRVVAVVVAYNRRDLLHEALDALAAQSLPLHKVVVIDNASTDDSAAVARNHPVGADVETLARNTGGAGGFAVGIARALERHSADLVWLMDDDTIPSPTAAEELLRVRSALPTVPALLASRVEWVDGSEHPMNKPRQRWGTRQSPLESELQAMPVRSASFVSLLIDGNAARTHTLPIADYFIWNDDFEYSTRLLQRAKGYYCASSIVTHKTKVLGSTDADPGERFFFEVRNKIWLFRFSSGLRIGEKFLFGAATLRRWARTIRRSQNREVVSGAGKRGRREGFSSAPRANVVSLADVGPAFTDVERFETAVADLARS